MVAVGIECRLPARDEWSAPLLGVGLRSGDESITDSDERRAREQCRTNLGQSEEETAVADWCIIIERENAQYHLTDRNRFGNAHDVLGHPMDTDDYVLHRR